MFLIKIYDKDEKIVFAGWVPDDAVLLSEGTNRPRVAEVTVPIQDLNSLLGKSFPK